MTTDRSMTPPRGGMGDEDAVPATGPSVPSQPAGDAEARDWLDLMAEADAEVDELEDAGCDVCDRPGCSGCDVGRGMIWDDGD